MTSLSETGGPLAVLAPAPAERLAVLRILAGGFATVYLRVRLPAFLAPDRSRTRTRFQPVGVAGPGWAQPLPDGAAPGPGRRRAGRSGSPTPSAPASASPARASPVCCCVLTTYRSSWGQLLHFENLMVLQVLVVGLTAGGADALLVGRRRRGARGRVPAVGSRYGWPVRLAALVTVATYVLAGRGEAATRRHRLDARRHACATTSAYSAVRLEALGGTPSPLGRALVGQAWAFPPLAVATVLIELAAPVALLGGRLRNAWVAAAWLLHAGVAALMFVVFPLPAAPRGVRAVLPAGAARPRRLVEPSGVLTVRP